MRVDLHQHLWPPGLIEGPASPQSGAPAGTARTLRLDGEPPYEVSS